MDFVTMCLETATASVDYTMAITISAIVVSIRVIALIVGIWMCFMKAGLPGWASIIPFYNLYCLFKITWDNGLYALLLLIPGINIAILIVTYYLLAKSFGMGISYVIGLVLFPDVVTLIFAFGEAEYRVIY